MDIVGYAKAHPAQTAAVAVIGVAVIWLMIPSANSGDTSTTAAAGSSDALLGAQLQIAQMNQAKSLSLSQMNADLAIAKENNSANLALAQLQVQGQNNANADQFNYLSYRDKLAAETDQSNIAANLTISNQTLESQTKIALAGFDTQRDIAFGQNQVAITQAGFARDITTAQIGATRDMAAIVAGVQNQQIVTQGQVANNQINAGVQVAKIQAGSQQTAGILGLVGNILRL